LRTNFSFERFLHAQLDALDRGLAARLHVRHRIGSKGHPGINLQTTGYETVFFPEILRSVAVAYNGGVTWTGRQRIRNDGIEQVRSAIMSSPSRRGHQSRCVPCEVLQVIGLAVRALHTATVGKASKRAT
jgi:hypothetical protein